MEQRRKIIVAGAGPAGLTAAIFAARQGAEVTILEGMERPGKKLLLTGNGRCNITNLDKQLPEAYYGSGREIAAALTRGFGAEEVCRFFEELGLLTQEKNGYVYPYSAQSSAVLEVLLAEVRRLKIKLKLSERIVAVYNTTVLPENRNPIKPDQKNMTGSDSRINSCECVVDTTENQRCTLWTVETATWKYQADAVIITCGSKCVPATGSDGSGYTLAESLGHRIVPVAPALVPVTCRFEELQSLAGVRCRAKVSLFKAGTKNGVQRTFLASELGELQWTKYGISGIVVFQLSRFVSNAAPNEKLNFELDLLPEFDSEQIRNLLLNRAGQIRNEKASVLLNGLLNDKLIPVILKEADKILAAEQESSEKGKNKKKIRSLTKYICSELNEMQLDAVIQAMKKLELPITGTKSFDTCQVCSGGVDCRELNPETLESRFHEGLYFAGEIVDVDGPCGGYNLQWAWSSGYAAGCAAAK